MLLLHLMHLCPFNLALHKRLQVRTRTWCTMMRAGAGGSVNLYGEKHETDDSRKNQRGKRGNGRVDFVHRHPTDNSSATPVLARSQQPFLLTKTILQVTSALILVLPFQLF
ncbi:hypothetical protein D8674_019599 [Pyrus ussuriensis x Pyrus communis]|uniref:Uncharacterized protein n=1 Tax=Pyrus ussuriensis x Pyrus communis TaxID=2448454 RepID=A0A5N5G8S5_9ROSA|nr:hypothetical protein D8674_019599 [Pyrus ussuriensis x Pyrus communis]